jgi:superfamily II DNA helicase RecQ
LQQLLLVCGIDRDDVRFVINADIPNSLEEFSQMSGRASRDGAPAQSYLLYSALVSIVFLLKIQAY